MNVPPGYFDHHKTQKLVRLASDELAVIWPLRLWEFCQLEKKHIHENMPPEALGDICRAFMQDKGRADDLLQECNFIIREGEQVTVPDFFEYNRGLFQRWAAGPLGGRPPKNKSVEPDGNRTVTGQEPDKNRTVTGQEPESDSGNRSLTNERKESKEKKDSKSSARAKGWMQECMLEDSRFKCLNGLYTAHSLFDDFIAHRQQMDKKQRINTKRCMSLLLLDAKRAVDLGGERLLCRMLADAMTRGWIAFWFTDKAVNLNRELEREESQKNGDVHGVSEFSNDSSV